MAANPHQDVMTVEEYLAAEETAEVKHEYVFGRVYAMSGGTIGHDAVGNNLRALIHTHLRGGPCRLCGPDVMLRISPDIYYYPDAFVVCDGPLDPRAREIWTPRLVIEVLSDSTEAHDRGDKFKQYQTLATLSDYLLVDGRERGVERFRRSEHGLWLYERYAPEASLTLESIGLTTPIAAFYDGTGL